MQQRKTRARTNLLRSKLTQRGQTTLPSGVRKALGLAAGAEIRYEIRGNRVVIWNGAEDEHEDPVVAGFLSFLERDMQTHPERLVPVTESFAARLRGLTEGVGVDRDERIEGEVAL